MSRGKIQPITLNFDTANQLDDQWLGVVRTAIEIPSEIFLAVVEQLLDHPEINSSSIMRADALCAPSLSQTPAFQGYECYQTTWRKLVARRHFDPPMIQDCAFYRKQDEILVTMRPVLCSECLQVRELDTVLPFYHPKCIGIAYRWTPSSLQIDFLPRQQDMPSDGSWPFPETSKLYRTALMLLTNLRKIAIGRLEGYKKRVHHDVIVPRVQYQDLYLQLKSKYTWIVDAWRENTDPMKHVFEDIAIATFLICLWKNLYSDGKPPGGFVDVGCGNGLLVFLLSQEGYEGYGIDLRRRKSWELWTGADLREQTFDPPSLVLSALNDADYTFNSGSFLIGNHADELTPWIPMFAAAIPGCQFINIPCCPFDFTQPFTRNTYDIPSECYQDSYRLSQAIVQFEGLLRDSGGRYGGYMNWLCEQTIQAGFVPEREALRIPSTKCWAFVGRERLEGDGWKEWVRDIAEASLKTWKARGGNARDH